MWGKKKENKQSQYNILYINFCKISLKTFLLKLQFASWKRRSYPISSINNLFFYFFLQQRPIFYDPLNVSLHKGPIIINHSNFNANSKEVLWSIIPCPNMPRIQNAIPKAKIWQETTYSFDSFVFVERRFTVFFSFQSIKAYYLGFFTHFALSLWKSNFHFENTI